MTEPTYIYHLHHRYETQLNKLHVHAASPNTKPNSLVRDPFVRDPHWLNRRIHSTLMLTDLNLYNFLKCRVQVDIHICNEDFSANDQDRDSNFSKALDGSRTDQSQDKIVQCNADMITINHRV